MSAQVENSSRTGYQYRLTLLTDNSDMWLHYHGIRKEELFIARGRGQLYNPRHPDESKQGHFPLLLLADGNPVGTVRLDHLPSPTIATAAIRLVAITRKEQGKGHGRVLNERVEMLARNQGVSLLVVNAIHTAVGFYKKVGYVPCAWKDTGQGLDDNITQMVKIIDQAD